MNRIILDNRVRVPRRVLSLDLVRELRTRFTYDNPDYAKARAFGFRKRVPREIVTAVDEGEYLTFPRGGFDVVREILQASDRWMRVEDRRFDGATWKAPPMRSTLYGYQEQLVATALARDVCLWRSPQASGKTMSALAYACALGRPTLVIVYTSNLLDQWVRRCTEQLGRADLVGVIQGQRRELRPITIGMQQTLWRFDRTQLRGKFGVVIADEVQLFASSTFQNVIDHVDARHVLGVSGDERRADGKEFLIYDQFGAVAAEVSQEVLVDAGFVHEVEVRVVPTRFTADWYRALPSMKQKLERYDDLLEAMAQDEERTAIVLRLIGECVRDRGQAIVLAARRDHCHRIDAQATASGIRSGLLIGGADYRDQFALTHRAFQAGEFQVAVGTLQAIGVGFDLPTVARGIIAAPVANSRQGRMQWQQYRGRFARTASGKTDSAMYYLLDERVFGVNPLRNLARWNRNVVVWTGETWTPVKTYLEGKKHEKAQRDTNLFVE